MTGMRRFINLVEGVERLDEIKERLSDEVMSEAFDLIYEYVTHGEVRLPSHMAHFEQSFARLMELLPRPTESRHVSRALRLTDEQFVQLQAGRLTLEPRRFMSWTTSVDVAERIAWIRGRIGHPVIVSIEAAADHIVVDVMEFYRTYGMKDESYFNFVRKEREVIVFHDQPLVLTPENTRVLERTNIVPPKVGDYLFVDDDENPYEIIDVPEDQPDAASGLFSVNARYYDRCEVRPIMVNGRQAEGEWETVDV